ncbi:DUF960 family protein [Enterococcus casseliflavus]|jgi:outer membrane lipoprotein-sorting protein|uniref:DUF960 family protein n=1 Tax=Enterococcus casseliflavus TaxID=37734 RepID=UPI0035CAFE35
MKIITKNIQKKLSKDLIGLMWRFYDEGYKGIELDDYQFLKIETMGNKTTMKMWQEEPKAMKIKSIPHYEDCEVWIINDGNGVTMLFPEDY